MKGSKGNKGEKKENSKDVESGKITEPTKVKKETAEQKRKLTEKGPIEEKEVIIIKEDFIPKVEIRCTDPFSYAILLKSNEMPCIIQACDILHDYIIKKPDVGEELIKKGMVQDILTGPTDSYPYYNGARYRFLAKLYELYPQVRPVIEARPDFLRMAMEDAVKTQDVALQAYSILYCVWLLEKFPDILDEFVKTYGMDLFFIKFLPQPDIDVKYNALGLMKLLLKHENSTKQLIHAISFNFNDLVDQISCPYPAIQNRALDIIIKLISLKDNEVLVHGKFFKAGGMQVIFQLLNVFEWRDIHSKVLQILKIFFRDEKYLYILGELNGITRLKNYVSFIIDDNLIAEDLQCILVIGSTYEGKMMLIKDNILELFVNILHDGSLDSKKLVCFGIRLLIEETVAILEIANTDPTRILMKIMLDKNKPLDLRCSSACTLSQLAKVAPLSKLILSRPHYFSRLVKMLGQPLQLSLDYCNCICSIMEAISSLLSIPLQLNKLLSFELTRNVMFFLEKENSGKKELAHFAAEILTWTLSREVGRDWFTGLSGVNMVMKLLYRTSDPVLLNNIGLLLRMVMEKDPVMTESFIKAGLPKWLIDNKDLWAGSPRLETATETLFRINPSLKLEYWGRLEPTDISVDGFHCSRSDRRGHFPLISDISKEDISSITPVYVVRMGIDLSLKEKDSLSFFDFDEKNLVVHHPRGRKSKPKYKKKMLNIYSNSLIKEARGKKLVVFKTDFKLRSLYEDLKEKFDKLPNNSESGRYIFRRWWVQLRIDLIAKRVAEVMSGGSSKQDCSYHTFQLHINELKLRLNTSVIPLGELEVGLKLERALLFKVLADRLGLPCALARGCYSVGWVEVALYPNDSPVKELPLRDLVTNYLVDLIKEPGRLVPLNTVEAVAYCGIPIPAALDRMPRNVPERKPAWMAPNEEVPEGIFHHIEIY